MNQDTFMRKIIAIAVLSVVCGIVYGQEVKPVVKDTMHTDVPDAGMMMPTSSSAAERLQPTSTAADQLPAVEGVPRIDPKAVETPVPSPYLMRWGGGGIVGYNGSVTNLTSFRNVAGANVFQQWGDLSVAGGVALSKGIGNGIGIVNDAAVNVQVGYRLSDNFSLHAFGGVSRAGFLGAPASMNGGSYGGFVTMMTNNQKWGMDVGVRRVYNNFTGQWETIPIAMPYYNLNGAKIGFDIGGLLYGLFSQAAGVPNKRGEGSPYNYDPDRGPAIIAPPINMGNIRMGPVETPKWVDQKNQF